MREFKSLAEFDAYLKSVLSQEKLHKREILEVAGQHVEDEAKRKFGIYQEAVGPFNEWDELKQETKDQRERLGFEPNNPLYRTGDLMQSIRHVVEGDTVFIGSNEDIMVYQELGTVRIPARPVLGPAAFESKKKLIAIVKEGMTAWLFKKAPIKKKL